MRRTIAALTALIIASSAQALGQEILLVPVPVGVSGTFSPLSVAVEGQLVIATSGKATGITLNDESLPTPGGKHQSFFHQTLADSLVLRARLSGTGGMEETTVELPRLHSPTLETAAGSGAAQVSVSVSGSSRLISGGRELAITNGRAALELSTTEPLSAVIEAEAPNGIRRLYNLSIIPKALMPAETQDSRTAKPSGETAASVPTSRSRHRVEVGTQFDAAARVLRLGYGVDSPGRLAGAAFLEALPGAPKNFALGVQGGIRVIQRSTPSKAPWLEAGWALKGGRLYTSMGSSRAVSPGVGGQEESEEPEDPDEEDPDSPFQELGAAVSRVGGSLSTGPYLRTVLLQLGPGTLGGRAEYGIGKTSPFGLWLELNFTW